MKTFKHLYETVTDFENLRQAFWSAARGKRRSIAVASFEYDLEANLLQLQQELRQQIYVPGQYTHFYIHDPKRRRISAAPFRDRVVHHALCRVIEPIWERRFIYDSYACRKQKGTHAAILRAQQLSRRFGYVLQCDLRHFFPSVDHALLKTTFRRVIADQKVLSLMDTIVDSGVGIHTEDHEPFFFPGDDLLAGLRPCGLPIGNLTSQFWANVYLNDLDQFVKRQLRCRGYVRYVDDFLLFAEEKQVLHEWRQAIIQFAAGLRLKLHESKASVFPTRTGIPFLGWRVYPDRLRLKRRNGIAFQRRFALLRKQVEAGQMELHRLHAAVRGWVAHVQFGQTYGLRRAILSRVVLPGGVGQ